MSRLSISAVSLFCVASLGTSPVFAQAIDPLQTVREFANYLTTPSGVSLLAGRGGTGTIALTCLPGGDQTTINEALSNGGANTVVSLCPRSIFNLTAPVVFTASGQELSTQGYPTDATRATLVVTGSAQATALVASCSDCSEVKIRNIQVNGNRPRLSYLPGGAALIEMGGATTGQLIDHVHSFEPRGWSALHIFEGGGICQGAQVTNNDIGPSGDPYYGILETKTPASQGEWADGISYACKNGIVSGNTVTDATDGAIVIFGAPGTQVFSNSVIARTRNLMGGINLVDFSPYQGNYRGTRVYQNSIRSAGAMIKVGIAIGPAVWSPSTDINHGGSVTNNDLSGFFGYGIAVAGVLNFTVTGNIVDGTFGGSHGSSYWQPPYNGGNPSDVTPGPFVIDLNNSTGTFTGQPFVDSKIVGLIGIQPPCPVGQFYSNGRCFSCCPDDPTGISCRTSAPIETILIGASYLHCAIGRRIIGVPGTRLCGAVGLPQSCTVACTERAMCSML